MRNLFIILTLLTTSNLLAQNYYGISLDGAESFYLNDDSNNGLDVSTEWTFECWLNLDTYTQYDRIFDRRTVFAIDIVAPNGSGDYAIRLTERNSSHGIVRTLETTSDYDLELDVWNHIAATFDGSTAKIFINNNEAASDAEINWELSNATTALNIGGLYNSGYANQIDAVLDEVRISNTARSLNDMQTSNRDTPYSADAHTVALFNFDDSGNPPSYSTGISHTGSTGDDDIDSNDYIDISESLYLENRAPQITGINDQFTDEHNTISIAIQTSDVNQDDLSVTVSETAGHAAVSHSDTSITIIPNANESWDGNGAIRIIVSDGELSDTSSFNYLDLAYQDNLNTLNLDGTNSFYINDDVDNHLDSPAESWFMETWIKVDDSATPGDWEVIMDRRSVFSWFIVPDATVPIGDYAVKYGVRNSDTLGDTLSSVGHEQVALFFDHWYHIAVGYDGSSARMWIGPYQVDSSNTGSWGLTSSTHALNIGARHWGSYERLLHGSLDEIRFLTSSPALNELELNRSGSQYVTDESTLLLIHLDETSNDPVYLTGIGFSGSAYGNSISNQDYVDVSSDLPFDGTDTNMAPFIYPVSQISGGESQLLEFTLYAFDETQATLTWSAESTLPSGAAFESSGNNGYFSWTPDLQQSGSYSLTFQVSDGNSVSRISFGTGTRTEKNSH